ncbi:MAG: addiction module protein [Fimbriiglobus sp.]
MSATMETLKTQAEALTASEKADLADYLISMLEGEDSIREAWRVEILRRAAEVRNGTAVGRPVEEVLEELREKYP